MSTPLLILGWGEFAVKTLDVADAVGGFDVRGFVAGVEPPPHGTHHAGRPVFWMDDLPFKPGDGLLVGGIGTTGRRELIETLQSRGFDFATLIHPSAIVSPRSIVQEGCVVHPGALISANTIVERHTVVNSGCIIGHDCRLGAFTTIGPGANIGGGTTIGSGAYVAIGAIIRDHLLVANDAVVGMGAVVVSPVEAGTMVTGSPARVVKTGVKGF